MYGMAPEQRQIGLGAIVVHLAYMILEHGGTTVKHVRDEWLIPLLASVRPPINTCPIQGLLSTCSIHRPSMASTECTSTDEALLKLKLYKRARVAAVTVEATAYMSYTYT